MDCSGTCQLYWTIGNYVTAYEYLMSRGGLQVAQILLSISIISHLNVIHCKYSTMSTWCLLVYGPKIVKQPFPHPHSIICSLSCTHSEDKIDITPT